MDFKGLGWLMVPHFGGGGLLPYTLNFSTQPDGALPAPWTGATWAVSGGAAKNTPTLGSELVTNGNMETGDPPTGWPVISAATVSSVADERTGGAGAQSLNVARNGGNFPSAGQNVATTTGGWYAISAWGRRVDASVASLQLEFGATFSSNYDATWSQKSFVYRALDALLNIRLVLNAAVDGESGRLDDVSIKLLSGLLAYRDFGQADVRVKANWTIAANLHAGVIARYADTSNYLYAYFGRMSNTVNLLKVVGGTTTSLISIAGVYVAGAPVEIRCTGNTVQLFYNNVQVGADQAEATLSANTKHGLFSTDVTNTVSLFNVVAN